MAIRVAINHKTHYKFDKPVKIYPHIVRLRPAPHSRTPIHAYTMKVGPKEHFINWQQDPFGNYQSRLLFPEKSDSLSFEVELVADLTSYNPFDFFIEEYAEQFPFEYDKQSKKELAPYLKKGHKSKLLQAWLDSVPLDKMDTNDFLVMLNQRLEKEIDYALRFEPGVQTPHQTLQRKCGSCRDTSWLLVQICRHLGLAARFASGYLVQLAQDEESLDGPSGPTEDFTDLHAWCEVFLPGAGWVGLDPTSGLFASEGHIPLACTPDPVSAAPIVGATGECEVEFEYSNEVVRILEDPRVTKPYTEQDWKNINALGALVDQKFEDNNVRLTMGGEPTFVSIDDMESAQWNTDALGQDKLRLAKELLLRLRDKYAPQGLLHYGQGKWYPGEEIPRWALGCFWRTDGLPIWNNNDLLARVDKDYGFGVKHANIFADELATRLEVGKDYVNSAYEDALYYIWQEEKLPEGVDPYNAKTKDGLERMRIAKVLRHGLDTPTGFVLPVAWDYQNKKWMSTPWKFRSDRVVLIPGDSPIGLRLPLDSLQMMSEDEMEPQRDPFAERDALAEMPVPGNSAKAEKTKSKQSSKKKTSKKQATKSKASAIKKGASVTKKIADYAPIRTSICVEPRDGRLHVFMPPLEYLEHYIELINAIEHTAHSLEMPVIIEGYEPPKDSRIQKLLVTPDPGVIEVNIHPANNWKELVDNTTTLYEQARLTRLGTEKFMVDGRHTGTGGGNHITLGGATPAESPLLRRPDLIRSLVTFWQHHPGLSYLFSGMFIGPTSQAPRVDEGRDEMLYELEVAFQQMPDGDVEQPWLVDRLMRNLLVDITGNTHRSEFCIDKLFSPGSASGRQGILEFRGFEMPPHSRMALVQALLLRCLVARFWEAPYKQPLIRWGTELHDKYLMPHYVWSDMKAVVQDLNDHGYPFRLEWLIPFEEFRFPHYGRLQLGDIQLGLRWAVEPWHVLGEEIGSFGTARYVDSSVERMQVMVDGLTDGRHIVVCNGRRMPLKSTGRNGQFVASVRYRAWQPPSALHPTIGIHAPLTFDIIDTWNGRAIGGCSYHVTHAGGRSYEAFPINSVEAETRRVNRFWDYGHTPGVVDDYSNQHLLREFFENKYESKPMVPPIEESSNEYPYTLDLRKKPSL